MMKDYGSKDATDTTNFSFYFATECSPRICKALQKLHCFFTKVMSPYRFFDGSGPKFFCRVNGLAVSGKLR